MVAARLRSLVSMLDQRTARNALWIGGGQWAGKTSVARALADRHGLAAYHYDFHDARAHNDRRIAARARNGEPIEGPDLDATWVHTPPEVMARNTIDGFPVRFQWVLDDLAALYSARPVIAEGWGLRPELVVDLTNDPGRMVVLVPTDDFRAHQAARLDRARSLGLDVSDMQRAQANRLARDRIVAAHAAKQARRLGVPVVEVDGHRDLATVVDDVESLLQQYLTVSS
jgi:hypothetical protein